LEKLYRKEKKLGFENMRLGHVHETNFTSIKELYIILISVTWAVPNKRPGAWHGMAWHVYVKN
jgi:hypothetical protein